MLPPPARLPTQNSTLHSSQEGWKTEPVGRGTWSILWTCLSTLWICVYSVSRYEIGIKPTPLRWKILFLLQNLVAPEYAFYMALEDFQNANGLKGWIRQRKDVKGASKWTLRHSFFFTMGGAVFYPYDADRHTDVLAWSHAANDNEDNSGRCARWIRANRPACERYVMAYKHLPALISDDRIAALSKSSWLLNSIAILQTSWTATQCVARASVGLDIALLELLTMAYIPVFVATALLWWKKPLLESTVMTIPINSQFNQPDWHLQLEDAGATSTGPEDADAASLRSTEPFKRLPFLLQMHLGGILPGLTLCGLHLLAWNYAFPTKAESIIWRVCSFVSIASCLLYGFCFVAYHTPWLRPVLKATWIRTGGDELLLAVPYIAARLILVILAFIGLRSMPSGVYQTVRWTQNIPHFH